MSFQELEFGNCVCEGHIIVTGLQVTRPKSETVTFRFLTQTRGLRVGGESYDFESHKAAQAQASASIPEMDVDEFGPVSSDRPIAIITGTQAGFVNYDPSSL